MITSCVIVSLDQLHVSMLFHGIDTADSTLRTRHCGLDITKEVRSYQVLLLVVWAWDSWWSGLLTKVGRGYLLKYSKLSRVYPAIVNTGEVKNHDNCWDFLETTAAHVL